MQDYQLMSYYRQVRPTVLKLMSLYHVRFWTRDDWEQEGMIILYELLESYPELTENVGQLRVYFKTKFSNYVKDILRRQGAVKRQFNQVSNKDIGDYANCLPSSNLSTEDYIIFCDCLAKIKQVLSPEQLVQLEKVMMGECFKGRKAFIRELRGLFEYR